MLSFCVTPSKEREYFKLISKNQRYTGDVRTLKQSTIPPARLRDHLLSPHWTASTSCLPSCLRVQTHTRIHRTHLITSMPKRKPHLLLSSWDTQLLPLPGCPGWAATAHPSHPHASPPAPLCPAHPSFRGTRPWSQKQNIAPCWPGEGHRTPWPLLLA